MQLVFLTAILTISILIITEITLVGIYKKAISTRKAALIEIVERSFLDDVKCSLAGKIPYGQQKLLSLAV